MVQCNPCIDALLLLADDKGVFGFDIFRNIGISSSGAVAKEHAICHVASQFMDRIPSKVHGNLSAWYRNTSIVAHTSGGHDVQRNLSDVVGRIANKSSQRHRTVVYKSTQVI